MFSPPSPLSFFFNDTATTEIYTLSLHDALPIYQHGEERGDPPQAGPVAHAGRSEEHTSELQSQFHLVCRLLLEKKKKEGKRNVIYERNRCQRRLPSERAPS